MIVTLLVLILLAVLWPRFIIGLFKACLFLVLAGILLMFIGVLYV